MADVNSARPPIQGSGYPLRKAIRHPEEYGGGPDVAIVCTQTDLSQSEQRKLVKHWCRVLPQMTDLRSVHFRSRVPQDLFDAVCELEGLEELFVKWSGIMSIERLPNLRHLEHLHIGDSAGLETIDPLAQLVTLKSLGLFNIKKIHDISVLGGLEGLETLSFGGGMYSTQRISTLEPIGCLKRLKSLSLVSLRTDDKTLAPLYALSNLEDFHVGTAWSSEEVAEIRRRNPRLLTNSNRTRPPSAAGK